MRLANLQPGVEPEWPDVDRLGLVRRVPSLDRITSRGGGTVSLTSVGQSTSLYTTVS